MVDDFGCDTLSDIFFGEGGTLATAFSLVVCYLFCVLAHDQFSSWGVLNCPYRLSPPFLYTRLDDSYGGSLCKKLLQLHRMVTHDTWLHSFPSGIPCLSFACHTAIAYPCTNIIRCMYLRSSSVTSDRGLGSRAEITNTKIYTNLRPRLYHYLQCYKSIQYLRKSNADSIRERLNPS
jgi:hypothetical protein